MENSINSSNSETTFSDLKSVFKKPADIYQAFEVSLEESAVTGQSNTSGTDLDTSAGTQKVLPFKKSRKSVPQRFSISLNDSLANSELEQSATFVKPQPIFKKKKNKSLVEFFNVSFNETNSHSRSHVLSQSLDDSNIPDKTNPFDKCVSKNKNETRIDSFLHVSQDDKGESSLEFQGPSYNIDVDEADSTTIATKENPFKKALEIQSNSATELQLSITDNSKSFNINTTKDKSNTISSSSLNHKTDSSSVRNKLNQSQPKISLQGRNSVISVTEERNSISLENTTLTDPKQSSKNISLDRNVSRITNSTTSFLEQSSINDENLNEWMSDDSDEEMPLPKVPSVTANLSHTKEKPAVPDSPTTGTNSVSIWEQKVAEIISNAGKKTQKRDSDFFLNSRPLKKSNQKERKPAEDLNQYKPPKLIKPAPFATKKLYEYVIKRLEPKYGIDKVIESENLVLSICDTVKKVTRRKSHQKRLIQNLKKEMAVAGLIETTMDFYEFVIKFLPYSFRVKVVPCLQPITNMVYPPKDVANPFDKIL